METPEARPEPRSRWYYSIWSVLIALFVVLGPIALPLLWRSPHFSRFWKVFLTLVVLALIGVMIASSIHIYDRLMDLLIPQETLRT